MKFQPAQPPAFLVKTFATLAGLALSTACLAVPGLQGGMTIGQLALDGGFWRAIGFFLAFMAIIFWVLLPLAYRWLRGRRNGSTFVRRHRWLLTIGAGVYAICAAIHVFSGQTIPTDQAIFLAVLTALLLGLLVMVWTVRPNDEQLQALATGDPARVLDERYELAQGRAAISALYIFLPALLVLGTLYDAFVTRLWPVRTLVETAALILIWNIMYFRWDKRL